MTHAQCPRRLLVIGPRPDLRPGCVRSLAPHPVVRADSPLAQLVEERRAAGVEVSVYRAPRGGR